MRLILAALLLLLLGCSEPTTDVSHTESIFFGDWVSTGVYESQEIRAAFNKDGNVTVSTIKEKPMTVPYKVETLDEWFDRRSHDLNMTRRQAHELYPMVTHVLTPQDPKAPGKSVLGNFFYRGSDDKLTLMLGIEFRREN